MTNELTIEQRLFKLEQKYNAQRCEIVNLDQRNAWLLKSNKELAKELDSQRSINDVIIPNVSIYDIYSMIQKVPWFTSRGNIIWSIVTYKMDDYVIIWINVIRREYEDCCDLVYEYQIVPLESYKKNKGSVLSLDFFDFVSVSAGDLSLRYAPMYLSSFINLFKTEERDDLHVLLDIWKEKDLPLEDQGDTCKKLLGQYLRNFIVNENL